jgi:AraC family transcriptional regulator of arabinose operon
MENDMRTDLVSTDNIPVPHILAIGYSGDRKVTRYGPSKRNQYIIHYVISGEGYFNGRIVKRGEGFLITPELPVEEYYSSAKDPWSFLWIISEDSAMEYYFDMHNADESSGIFKFHNEYVLEGVVRELGETDALSVSSPLLAELFLRIFNSSVAGGFGNISGARRYLDFASGFIKANVHLPISVSEICKMIGVSQPYLYNVFKEHLGMSTKAYISACKLSEAKRLLSETDFNVTEVASAVGFADSLAFSRFFSKEVGCSPTEYRKADRVKKTE